MIEKNIVEGYTHYRLNGMMHKTNGSAVIYPDGGKGGWYLYDVHHRYYGPALQWLGWYIRGVKVKD